LAPESNNSQIQVQNPLAMATDDSMQARISPECPDDTRQILYHAWGHDVPGLKKVIDVPGKASCRDPTTSETPLHAAIRACGPAATRDDVECDDGEGEDGAVEEAKETVHELFLSGAIWNDVDNNNETPGCVAWRLGQKELYRLCVEAGVRAELLFGLLDGYEELSSGPDEEEEQKEAGEQTGVGENGAEHMQDDDAEGLEEPNTDREDQVTSEEYLKSELAYSNDKLVDDVGNGVMMAWETSIMRQSVDALLPSLPPGKRILNVGFGMGIVDAMFAETKPSRHHIIEAHPAVLTHLSEPTSKFGPAWESTGPDDGAYKVYAGKWQDVVPELLQNGEVYDAIYFDTFGEDYSQLKLFFTEYIIGLLDESGRFGFFNGLGADRRICYDVYTKVVEMHLADAGLDLDWIEVGVDMNGLEEAGKGDWEGVRRRYWTLDSTYSAPVYGSA
jgi:type IV protein arginine methyltransferase